MKKMVITLALIANSLTFAADTLKLKQVLNDIEPMLQGGVEIYKLQPTTSIKLALQALAQQSKHVESQDEFNEAWTDGDEAWGADSLAWSAANFKEGFDYISAFPENYWIDLSSDELVKLEESYRVGKEAFKSLKNENLLWGVAPMGGIQCGITFPALVIVDPSTGETYVISKEGSEC